MVSLTDMDGTARERVGCFANRWLLSVEVTTCIYFPAYMRLGR